MVQWFTSVFRIFLVVMLGTGVGWYFGYAQLGLILSLTAVVLFWSYQVFRMQQWLNQSDQPPPDVMGIWGDIVSRVHKHQREARDNEQRLQSLVDYLLQSFTSMRDGVVLVERGGGIRWCNEVASRLLSLRYPQDTGQAITNLVRYPEFITYFTAGDYDSPLQFATDGEHRLHLQLIVTSFGEGDRLLFVQDVTAMVRLEEIRRDFIGNVSHELRTPLTVITGYVGNFMLDQQRFPQPYRKALLQMQQQAVRMENLLKDLLWLSRIEGDEWRQKKDSVDVAALLQELRDELVGTQPERKLVFDVSCRHKVVGDYRELYSAVSNLVLNAFKYSEPDTEVLVSWGAGEGGFRLSVVDRGMGIEAVHLPRLTERFYRVDDSRSSATGGTGLGLAIVKHVAASHSAGLHIASQPGKGSEFTLVFPSSDDYDSTLLVTELLAVAGED